MRLIALLLSVTLTGPAALSLLCDGACAAKHARAPEASGGCHDHGTSAASPMMAAGHTCHDVSAADASILTTTPHVDLLLAVVPVVASTQAEQAAAAAGVVVRPPGISHAPPALIPLRI